MRGGLPIHWLESNGWLVLSGSADFHSDIRALSLSRCDAAGAVAYISLACDAGDSLMDDMVELGAPAGYLVDLEDEDNNAIHERLSAAGMIVVESGDDIVRLKKLITQTVLHTVKGALKDGGLVLFEGLAATLAGAFYLDGRGELVPGLKLVDNAFIATDADRAQWEDVRDSVYFKNQEAVGIAIESGAALVLGPDGLIETWGEKQVTFSLGDPSGLGSN